MTTIMYCDADQEPERRLGFRRIGTVLRMTFPTGGGVARVTLPMELDEAIEHALGAHGWECARGG